MLWAGMACLGRGRCGVGGAGYDSVLEVGTWGACLSVCDKFNLCKLGDGELPGFVRLALGRGWLCPLCSVSGWAWCGLLQCGWVAGHALAGTVGLLCARDGPAGRPYMKQGVNGRDGICLTLHGGRSRRGVGARDGEKT